MRNDQERKLIRSIIGALDAESVFDENEIQTLENHHSIISEALSPALKDDNLGPVFVILSLSLYIGALLTLMEKAGMDGEDHYEKFSLNVEAIMDNLEIVDYLH